MKKFIEHFLTTLPSLIVPLIVVIILSYATPIFAWLFLGVMAINALSEGFDKIASAIRDRSAP